MTLSNPNPYLAANFAIFSCTGSTAGASSNIGSSIGSTPVFPSGFNIPLSVEFSGFTGFSLGFGASGKESVGLFSLLP